MLRLSWLLLLALPSLAFAQVAAPRHTQDLVVYDPTTGVVRMVVVPDDDKELSDPAFNPQDCGPQQNTPCAVAPVAHSAVALGQDPVAIAATAKGVLLSFQPAGVTVAPVVTVTDPGVPAQ